MTPKEKAEELIRKFFPDLKCSLELELIGVRKKHAKKNALIAVDEILNEYWSHDIKRRDWWLEVKQEIEKL